MFKPFAFARKSKTFSYRCSCCGEKHAGAPSFATDRPFLCLDILDKEYEDRVFLNSDLCVIDNEHYFIRVTLTVPIHGSDEGFIFGDWVSQSQESFKKYIDSLGQDQSGQSSFGWWPVTSSAYREHEEPPAFLKANVVWLETGQRPEVILHPEETHQLGIDQRKGISWERAVELATRLLHPDTGANR